MFNQFVIDRALLFFLVGEAVAFLERNGWLDPTIHSDNVQVTTEIMSYLFSIVLAIAYYIYHHKNPPTSAIPVPVALDPNTPIVPPSSKLNLQPLFDIIKKLFMQVLEKPKQEPLPQ